MAATTAVTALVVAFHRSESLRRLLAGLDGLPAVVVNVEADPHVAEVARSFPLASEVVLEGNPGFAAAVNAGAAVVRAGAIVFLNDDVVVGGDDLRRLVRAMDEAGAAAAVPVHVDASGARQPMLATRPSVRGLVLEGLLLPDRPVPGLRHVLRPQKWRMPERVEAVEVATAACVATAPGLLDRHPLPEAYFLYWEEVEWFDVLARAGLTAVVVPDVAVTHTGGRADVRPEKQRLLARNAVRCLRRTRGRLTAALGVPVVVAWQARLLAGDAVRRRDRVPARRAGLRAALGAWREVR